MSCSSCSASQAPLAFAGFQQPAAPLAFGGLQSLNFGAPLNLGAQFAAPAPFALGAAQPFNLPAFGLNNNFALNGPLGLNLLGLDGLNLGSQLSPWSGLGNLGLAGLGSYGLPAYGSYNLAGLGAPAPAFSLGAPAPAYGLGSFGNFQGFGAF